MRQIMDPSQHQHQNAHQQYANNLAYTPQLPGQPAHIFPNYSGEDSPTTASIHGIPSYHAHDYDDDVDERGNGEGQGDPKRRRIARACDMCRKKKIKCDGKLPKCSHCENYKTECIFTQVEKKRNPPKGAKYIEGLENRLGRMESLLRMSGLLGEEDNGRTDLGTLEKRLADKQAAGSSGARSSFDSPTSPAVTTHRDRSASANHSPPINGGIPSPNTLAPTPDAAAGRPHNTQQVEALADQMCSLVTNNCGETRYIGSSSGFSIFSPKGIQWVNEKTGDSSFHDMISQAAADDKHWAHWKPEVFGDIFHRRTFRPLPPKNEAMALLKDYFTNFNAMFPLFHEPTFMHLVDRHYSLEPYEGSGWWASLNVALAIAHRLRVMSDVDSHGEDDKAWGYLKNALAVQAELTLRNNDLLSVQALLGLAMFMQGTPNPQPGFFLLSAALRLAHSIGLHKRGSDFNLNDVESEQRKRVFWIAYVMDKDICLRSGRPPVQDDDDMNVDLPSEDPADNIGNVALGDGKEKINLFRLQCVFATIQSKVYKQLYSVKASRQSDGELLNTIGELDQELEAWKDSIPVDFRPEHEIKLPHAALRLHVVTLHFAYYNCLTTIHRMSVHHGYWTSRLSDYAIAGLNARPLNPRVFMSAALCVNAARTSISLVKYIPKGDHACVWLVLYYPVSALVTLFANILQNPQDARARPDLKLMHSVCQYLSELCQADSNIHCRRMLSICSEFERIATVALEKAEREMRGRGKRKAPEKDPEEAIDQKPAQVPPPKTAKTMQPPQVPATRTPNMGSSYLMHNGSNTTSPSGMRQVNTATSSPCAPLLMGNIPLTSPSQSPYTTTVDLNGVSRFNQSPASGFAPFSAPSSIPPAMFGQDAMLNDYNWGNGDSTVNGSFQQPFVPQDLWQMPMTLEWDWADMLNTGAQPNFNFDDMGALNDGNNQQH